MKRYAIVSYNMYCNFTNYGSALQTYALQRAVNEHFSGRLETIVLDYCPDILKDCNVLDPIHRMWDADEESIQMCKLSMPAIRINFDKFKRFYREYYQLSTRSYTSENFERSLTDEKLDGYICGSDTIFCPDEFGFDDGFYANYQCMKDSYVVTYAASFGDPHFDVDGYKKLNARLKNFKAISLREEAMLPYVKEHTSVPVCRVVDPTLLLTEQEYEKIIAERQHERKYLLLYVRRYNRAMEEYAEKLAEQRGLDIVEISLRAVNAKKRRMFYEAGPEEFLSLVKYAEYVVTNSYHGVIFCLQMNTDFSVFSREQCDAKIDELLDLTGLTNRKMITGMEKISDGVDFAEVHRKLDKMRKESIEYLRKVL